MDEPKFEQDFEARHERLGALKVATAEILYDQLCDAGLLQRSTENYRKIEGVSLKVAQLVVGSLWPWGDFVDVEHVEEDFHPVGPRRPLQSASSDDDDFPF